MNAVLSSPTPIKVLGESLVSLPQDLYIPPDALQIILTEVFEGPLDLLLYLIKKHNLDILNIPVAEITHQYVSYVEVMTVFQLELAADYLEMAALLAEIKSRMLLPQPKSEEALEEDPRAELIRRLQEYERIKKAAENLDQLPRQEREFYCVWVPIPEELKSRPQPSVSMEELWHAFQDLLKRVDLQAVHTIQREVLSVRERMSRVLAQLEGDTFLPFLSFFDVEEGRMGIVVTFLAMLELMKETLIELSQGEPFGAIYIRAATC